MQRGPAFPQRRRDRSAHRAGSDPDKVAQAGSSRDPFWRQARERDRHQRNEEERHSHALDHGRDHDGHEVGLGVEARAHPQHQRQHQEGDRDVAPRVDFGDCLAHHRRQDDRHQADWRQHHAGFGGRVAHELLQPQRQQHHVAEEQPVADRNAEGAGPEVANLEQAQIDHRMLVGQLPDQEEGEAHHGRDRQAHDQAGMEPVVLLAQVQHHLHRRDPDHQQRQSQLVNGQLVDDAFAFAVDRPRRQRRDDADRDVDVEDPRPVDVVGDPAAQQRTHHRRDQGGDCPHRHRQPGQRFRIAGQQQRLRERDHRPGDEALQRAERNQRRHVRRQAAQQRRHHEQDHAADEQPDLAEALRQPAGQRHGDRVGDREAGDHPGALVRADAQVAGDGGQRHVRDRRVQHVHERGRGERDRAPHTR